MTAEQLRAARALLRLDQSSLARQAAVSVPSIKRFEAMDGTIHGRASTVAKLRQTLEGAGVVFVMLNGTRPGVCLAQRD